MIPLREIDALVRALERFRGAFDCAYPGYAAGIADTTHDKAETVRNAGSALNYAIRWAEYRRRHNADPEP